MKKIALIIEIYNGTSYDDVCVVSAPEDKIEAIKTQISTIDWNGDGKKIFERVKQAMDELEIETEVMESKTLLGPMIRN